MAIVLNEIYEVEITGMNHDGNGVTRIEGEVVFVKGALTGEVLKIRINKKYKSVYWAEILQILKTCKERVDAVCDVYNSCGGCKLQHLSYEGQLKFKRELVFNALNRIAKANIDFEMVRPVKGMRKPYNYRNKAILFAGEEAGKVVLRFKEEASNKLAPESCSFLFPEKVNLFLKKLEQLFSKHEVAVEDALLGVMVRYSSYMDKIQLVIIAKNQFVRDTDLLISDLKNTCSNIAGIGLAMHKDNKAADMFSIYRGVEIVFGSKYLEEKIGEKVYRLSPASFFQVNTEQTKILYDCVKEFAALNSEDIVLDAYCGTGTIGIYAADKAAKLIGIDVVEEAIKDAKYNAVANELVADYYKGKVEDILPKLLKEGLMPTVVILDPPRKGCDKKMLKALKQLAPNNILYVSCDPSTLARDIKILFEYGYKLIKIQPVDMFPQTTHVESIILMTYCGSEGK
jgi:23S rRNA (uracil1939-C5)-methyltransferase